LERATPQEDLIRFAALLRATAEQLSALAPLLTHDEATRFSAELEGPSHDLGAALEAWNQRQGN
jgi:hypothetical protein